MAVSGRALLGASLLLGRLARQRGDRGVLGAFRSVRGFGAHLVHALKKLQQEGVSKGCASVRGGELLGERRVV